MDALKKALQTGIGHKEKKIIHSMEKTNKMSEKKEYIAKKIGRK